MTMTPAAIAIRLMMTCTAVKTERLIPRIMARSPVEDNGCYDLGSKIAIAATPEHSAA